MFSRRYVTRQILTSRENFSYAQCFREGVSGLLTSIEFNNNKKNRLDLRDNGVGRDGGVSLDCLIAAF